MSTGTLVRLAAELLALLVLCLVCAPGANRFATSWR